MLLFFEVQIAEGKTAEYLDIANEIKSKLAKIEGFISVERFQSLTNEDKILSLSFGEMKNPFKNGVHWNHIDLHNLKGVVAY